MDILARFQFQHCQPPFSGDRQQIGPSARQSSLRQEFAMEALRKQIGVD
jgi:hypothetical protein